MDSPFDNAPPVDPESARYAATLRLIAATGSAPAEDIAAALRYVHMRSDQAAELPAIARRFVRNTMS